MRFEIRMPAGRDRFDAEAAQSLIGQQPRLNLRSEESGPILADYGTATVVEAEVVEDGRAMLLTLETDDPQVERLIGLPPDMMGYSIAPRSDDVPDPHGRGIVNWSSWPVPAVPDLSDQWKP